MALDARFNTIPCTGGAFTSSEHERATTIPEQSGSMSMRTLLQNIAHRLHAVQDRLTVQMQIAAATAFMSVVLVGALAGSAALISYRNTAELLNSGLASVASITSNRLDRYMAVRQQEMHLFSRLQPLQPLWQGQPKELRRSLEQ